MDVIYVLAISVLLQFTAAFLALRLIQITGGRIAWILISAAISLMAIRRSITLLNLISGEAHPPEMIAELVALATSILIVVGIAMIAPIFRSIKHSEEALHKINRALMVLTMTNQVIIRAIEEAALLKDVCRTIVEVGGYRLVWVGFAEQDEEKTVRPIAYAGHEEGYLDTVNITRADTEGGRGPTGKAILTGKPCVVKDIRIDPDYGHYRDEAVKRGYASLISLPLIANNKTLGALNIYATETDAFDIEEVNLLTELANDMAFGTMALRTRAERNRADEALELLRRQNELILKSAGEGILGLDLEGKHTFVNPVAARMLGYEIEELIDQPSHAIWHHSKPDGTSYPVEECPVYAAYRDGAIYHRDDEVFWRKDSTSFPVEYSSTPIQEGDKLIGAVVTFRDITWRKLAEEKLRESEKKYRTLLETLPQKIFHKDKNSVYASCNANYARDLKIKPAEIAGKTDYDFFSEELAEKYRTDDKRIIESGKIEDIQEEYIQNGQKCFVHTVKTPVRDDKGNVIGILGIFWDITEKEKMEEEIKKRVKELEEFYQMAVGRELRMKELKEKIESLKKELSKYKKDE
jgi:PAS domain S-box-containing protein